MADADLIQAVDNLAGWLSNIHEELEKIRETLEEALKGKPKSGGVMQAGILDELSELRNTVEYIHSAIEKKG